MKEVGYMADAVEFRVWAKQQPYTFNTLEDDLKAAVDENDYTEALPQNVMDEILERQGMLQDSYPFQCDGYSIRVKPEVSTFSYLFCLGLSLLPPDLIENEQRCRQFETIAMDAASAFFGGDAIRIGAPWRDPTTPSYGVLLDRVVALIPDLGPRVRDTAPDGGDGGWDVLVVKGFADKKFPRFVALGNCATGLHDWKRKGREREPRFFWSFFSGNHRSTFMTFFAVPFVMNEEWRLSKSSETTITFDRFRICEHAPKSSEDAAAWLESTRAAALNVPFN